LELVVAAVGFDVGLIPYTPTGLNYANCCPNKLSQYMAAGLPILACRTSFVEQIVGDAAAGAVVDFSDTDSLVKEVNRFVCDIDYRLRSGRSSANYFSSNFHWEVLSQPFLAKLAMLARLSSLRIGQDFSISGPTPFFPDVAMPVPRKSLLDMLRGIWRLLPASVRLRLRPTVRRLVERFHLALR
jgi:hypothetical protein